MVFQELSGLTGIPLNCILPVKNFHCEMEVERDVGMHVLKALREILNTATTNFRMMED